MKYIFDDSDYKGSKSGLKRFWMLSVYISNESVLKGCIMATDITYMEI